MLKAEVIGNLGADAKVVSENGYAFIKFNVAHTDRWTDQDGKEHTATQWVSCIINDSNSKLLPFLTKGKQVFVRGNLTARVFSSEKERRMVAGLNLNVREIELVGGVSREVPRELITKDGQLVKVFDAWFLDPQAGIKSTTLVDRTGNEYEVNESSFVRPLRQADATNNDNNNQQQDGATFD